MVKAVIDIGTVSIKFCVAEEHPEKIFEVIKDENDIKKLGSGLKKTGKISMPSLERNAVSVAEFVKQARDLGSDEIVIVGTMALRSADNRADFIKRVKELTGLDVNVLSGEEEADISFVAVRYGVTGAMEKDFVMLDTGGGSSEFVFSEKGTLKRKLSINVGAIRITEQYFLKTPVTGEILAMAGAEIRRELVGSGVVKGPDFMIGIGGNVTSMAAVKHKMAVYDPGIIHCSELTLSDIKSQIETFASMTLNERMNIVGLQPDRADVILAGACIVREAMEICGATELTVSDYGLRHGVMYTLFGGNGNKGRSWYLDH